MNKTIENIATITRPIFKKYQIKSAGLFGSYARGDARPDSDIDILISFGEKTLSLWDMVGFRDEVSEILQKPVDIVSDKSIVPYFRDYIYRDLKPIYE